MSVLVGQVAACSTGTGPGTHARHESQAQAPAVKPAGSGPLSWILTKVALNALIADSHVRAQLSGAQIFEILTGTERPATALAVVPTMSFKSFATLEDTLIRGTLRPDIRAVIYDAEHWAQTPTDEQRDPATFYQRAAQLAHAHGLIFIATPAMDLVNADGGKAADPATAFVDRRIGADAAQSADVVDIQAQSLERDAAAYRSFVARVSAQIRAVNPKVTVLAGLSTNPHGSAITPDMLVAAMLGAAGQVTGFWMNVPGKGSDCPKCNAPQPDVAVAALSDGRMARLAEIFAPSDAASGLSATPKSSS
ncbi:hypothetical protein [Catenulispora rubra]|uniref:hypothetical protein n=1 Tax=Catenulispora rubra TaxID=280293 RepID=UPI0018923130|nr:hypothetical protein [Catenulispora rubra]